MTSTDQQENGHNKGIDAEPPQLKDNKNINEELQKAQQEPTGITPKIGCGHRSKLLRTGRAGRPRKVYNMVSEEEVEDECEEASLCEVPITQALNKSDTQEGLHVMANEVRSILKNDTWTLIDRPSYETSISQTEHSKNAKFG